MSPMELKHDVDFFLLLHCEFHFIYAAIISVTYFAFGFQEFIICVLLFLFAQSLDVSQPLLPFPTLQSLLEDFLSSYLFSKAYKYLELFLQLARQLQNCAVKLSPSYNILSRKLSYCSRVETSGFIHMSYNYVYFFPILYLETFVSSS